MRYSATLTPLLLTLVVAAAPCQSDPTAVRLDSALRALEAKGFSGVIRVDKDGATVLEKGYGLANREERRPFDPSTVVQIGSNTKDFTLVALLQLQEQRNHLSLQSAFLWGLHVPGARVHSCHQEDRQ